jgi:F-type H+-transporting ATPase subunit epsilon
MADSRRKLEAQVLTPEREVFNGELVQLSTRTTLGEIGILARHVPMVARLEPTELRLHLSESETLRFAQGEGWLEVFANRARVRVAEAVPPESLDTSDLRGRLDEVERELGESEPGSAARDAAERERRRLEAFLQIADNR